MNKEEAIKILKELDKNANVENADMNDVFGGEHLEAIETVLEELENSISKDKIRAKIQYCQSCIRDSDFADLDDYNKMKYGEIVLKELLEESN